MLPGLLQGDNVFILVHIMHNYGASKVTEWLPLIQRNMTRMWRDQILCSIKQGRNMMSKEAQAVLVGVRMVKKWIERLNGPHNM